MTPDAPEAVVVSPRSAVLMTILRISGAGLLLAAAALKAVEPGMPEWLRPLGNVGLAILALSVGAETTVGLLLLRRSASRDVHHLAATLFGLLAGIAIALFVSGVRSCGCFGGLTVRPLSMAVVDGGFAAFFAWSAPAVCRTSSRRAYGAIAAGAVIAAILVLRSTVASGGLPAQESLLAADPSSFDVGRVTEEQARHIERTFRVVNTTNRAVHIKELVRTCTCTSATASAQEIAPGRSADIKVVVDWSGRRGPQRADVSIVSAEAFPLQTLTIQGVVDVGIVVVPEKIGLGDVPPGELIRREVTVASTDGLIGTASIPDVRPLTPSSSAVTVTPITPEGPAIVGRTFLIEVRTDDLSPKEGQVLVPFVAAGPDGRKVEVALTYHRMASVEPQTKALRFSVGATTPQTVRFRRFRSAPVVEFRTTSEAFEVAAVRELRDGDGVHIDV